VPRVVEFNCRFGDPECQVLMARLKSDIGPALVATSDGTLRDFDLRWYDESAVCVVMASRGYPGAYEKGSEIRGLERAEEVEGVTVFHAGTAARDGRIVATGGRVRGVTALGRDLVDAQAHAYAAVDRIDWPDGFHRRDIGWRALQKERKA
jgi:phosphoribosylamine---glycine ligase